MRFPWKLNYDLTKYIIVNKMKGVEKYPLVLMLEPTHLCNLCLLYTSPSPRDSTSSRMPSSA